MGIQHLFVEDAKLRDIAYRVDSGIDVTTRIVKTDGVAKIAR